ncbi:RAxF-45 family protein [Alkalihalobacillus trypoxylicola]|nr:RAxF-45 family protein [Alkalihalobacillus trypoxylicola]
MKVLSVLRGFLWSFLLFCRAKFAVLVANGTDLPNFSN